MRTVRSIVVLVAVVGVAMASLAWACEIPGQPNTHIGVITGIDPAKRTLTLRDAQTSATLTFAVSPELLAGVAVRDRVAIVYAAEGQTLRATSIRKTGS
jgi:hypothetical protein